MLSMATRVARNVVPQDTHTANHAQYARLNCLGEESDAGFNGKGGSAARRREGSKRGSGPR